MNLPWKDKPNKAAQVQRRHKELDDIQVATDVAEIMKTPAGRRTFMRILVQGGIYRKIENGPDLPFVAGRRNAALEVLQAVNAHAVEAAMLALTEHNIEMTRRNRELLAAQLEDAKSRKDS